MTHLRTLASSARPLAEVLVDALRRQTNALSRPDTNDKNDGQGTLPLEDNAANIDDDVPTHALRPDKVAAAVLLGRAFDEQRNILAVLRNSDNVTVIEAPAPEYVAEIERILKGHILGPDVLVHEGSDLQPSATKIADPGTVVIFARGPDSKSKTSTGNAEFARAVQARCSVIGIAADPERLLPADLLRSADYRIVVPQLDGQAIATVIEAVTGCHPGAVEPDFGRITLSDLMVSVRADLGAEASLARLRRLLRSAMKNDASTPPLSEMHGLGEAKVWGMALASDLRDYKAGHLAWSVVDKGCLLSGPPGTGKTSFARSLAKETGMHFIATSYSQWQAHKEGHLGNVTQAIRNAFAESANMLPSILFIDEIDTLPARGSARWNDDWWTSITNTLLECLDGFERREGVVVIAACNDPSRLDPALVRSGRLDKHIRIPMPDTPALADILRSHLGEDLKNDDLLPAAVAAFGRTGADIERWVRTARRTARIAQRSLSLDDVVAAIRDGEPELPSEVRRGIAYHEAGHAVACIALGVADPIALSISRSGGLAQTSPGRMEAQTKSHLESYLVCLLAGRASDELVFGAATAGAGGSEESDLSRATRLATQFETTFGLGDLGPLWIGDSVGERDLLMFSDLRKTVRHTLERAHAAAKALLSENRVTLDCLAEALFLRGYLNRSEIEAILVQAPLRTKMVSDRLAAQPAQTDGPQDGSDREAIASYDALTITLAQA